ncbi:aryl-alcohol dehydrogenase-like predicted oxidoreductase [Algoriphagus ratkowskyi]|uniref:Aldo/keto reductase n=1 Tax=Algoriphagus ratkowskyi TaxID=57028 RepID=A0A2W7RRR2_9BACT|nr:aldo/keto reductase [Algoriphagus ratkowskyi]PZX61210.1 aryl-alcohol dehydrogenase-like predicted oxidoreductase [Algoriphagus ratkowskyi]TXD79329.1 aldo/keto reductase [Algoriphagus ratkowskyi]
MEKIKLPALDFEISPIALGCMSLKGNIKSDQQIIDAAISGGINFLDTADLYQKGLNEEIVGAAVKGRRKHIILASKVGNQWREDGSGWDWNPKKAYILKCAEESLQRLQTDYIDLYQLHGGTLEDPWDETLEAFEILKSQGKIRAFGISSIRPNVIRKVLELYPPATIMMQYNPLDRRPEETAFPLIATSKARVLVRGTFAKGLLIDKSAESYMDHSDEEVGKVRKLIAVSGMLPEAFLIRFGLNQAAVGSLVIGASSVEQVEKMLLGYEQNEMISEELLQEITKQLPLNLYTQHR